MSSQATKKKKIWEAEAFSKRQAEAIYSDGPRLVLYAAAVLLALAVAYFGLAFRPDFEVVDTKDTLKLKEILSSGSPWLVLCKLHDDSLPEGFEANLKHLGATRAAIVQCDKTLPSSGMTVAAKYKLDLTKKPVAFLTVGGNKVQLDPKLVKSDVKLELSKQIRKTVAKRLSITDLKDARKVRTACAKVRCVLWGASVSFFGPRKALEHPRWFHYRLPSNVAVNNKQVDDVVTVVWTQGDERYALTADGEAVKDAQEALQLVDSDPSFAAKRAVKLPFEWSTMLQKSTPPPTRSQVTKQKQQKTAPPMPRPTPPVEKEPLQEDQEDSGLDLDGDDENAIDIDL